MNKKGFTLVELLATLTILVLMSVIIGVNITSILKSTEDTEEEFDKEQIEKAACVYVDSTKNANNDCTNTSAYSSTSCTNINVNKLVGAGLLGNDYVVDDTTTPIKICYSGGEKFCEYKCNSAKETCHCP